MTEIANNQSRVASNERQLRIAIEFLRELFNDHADRGTYGTAGVEIKFKAGIAIGVRRTLDATHQ